MTSRRKTELNTGLFRAREDIEQEAQSGISGDMSRSLKRASFDIYEDQIARLGQLKYKRGEKISDMVRDALDAYLAKHE